MRRRLLARASRNHLLRHPWQLALCVLGVALGVAVVTGIQLANASARRAFTLAAETVAGRATDEIVGGPTGLPDSVYRRVRVEAGVARAAPVLDGDVVVAGSGGGRSLELLGVDPFAEAAFRPGLGPGTDMADGGAARPGSWPGASALITVPGAVLLSVETARALGVRPGDSLTVRAGDRRARLVLAGEVAPVGEVERVGARTLMLADIATAQEVLGMNGRLTRIDLILPTGAPGSEIRRRLRAVLPADAGIVPAGARGETMQQMTRAFSINLTALSLLALIFGMFLIYGAMSFSVVQRRSMFGALRAIGVTRRQLLGLVLLEALGLGVVGTLLGLGLGIALGQGLLRLVTRTINDLYFVVAVRGVSLRAGVLLTMGGLGLVATLASTLPAALEATTTPPRAALTRSVLEERFRRLLPRLALAGAGMVAAGGTTLLASGHQLVVAFVGLFAIVLGAACLIPAAARGLMLAARTPLRRSTGLTGAMAAGGAATSLSRTAPAVTALSIAVSVTVALGIMIGSFRRTVESWLGTRLDADVYVSAAGGAGGPVGSLDPRLIRRLGAVAGSASMSTSRDVQVRLLHGSSRLIALDVAGQRAPPLRLKSGRPGRVWPAFRAGDVVVSEPFAYWHGVHLGDSIAVWTDRGKHYFRVAGVFEDYGSDRGVIALDRRTYDAYWDDPGVTALDVNAAAGLPVDTLVERLRRAAGDAAVMIRSNRALRAASLRVFDRTFAVTGVLRTLAFIVAFIGVLGALMALQLERSRELAVLRATGLTQAELWRLVTLQTGLTGLVAGLLALPLGAVMAALMVYVINRRSFGWTLQFHVTASVAVEALALAVAAALLAGLYPAWRMAGASPAEALRREA